MSKILGAILFAISLSASAQPLQMSQSISLTPETAEVIDALMATSPTTALSVLYVLKECQQPVTLHRMKLAARSSSFWDVLQRVGEGSVPEASEGMCAIFE